jgi:hypothetical protein
VISSCIIIVIMQRYAVNRRGIRLKIVTALGQEHTAVAVKTAL